MRASGERAGRTAGPWVWLGLWAAAGCATGDDPHLQTGDDGGLEAQSEFAAEDSGSEGAADEAGVEDVILPDGEAGCPDGTLDCGGRCVDPATDAEHCGACGTVCPDGLNAEGVCERRVCGLRCSPGWQDRDGAPGCEFACEGETPDEACNGLDDDCDGLTDEGFPCAVGRTTGCTTTCGTGGTGVCSPACTPPAPAACTPPAEVCNRADDDCDGVTDDGFDCPAGAAGPCTASCGSAGTRTCSPLCAWGACTPPAEACNGADDDCDGSPDDGFPCAAGASGACTTACGSSGTRTCTPACGWETCAPPAETCNRGDDDCDGAVDEGFRAQVQTVAYADLAAYHPPCDFWTEAIGPNCNAAIHRYCGRAGACTHTGYGPNDYGDAAATVTCLAGAVEVVTSYSVLATHHAGCDGTFLRYGPDCSAAINRLCMSLGQVSGFGPVENSGDTAYVVCVPSSIAVSVGASYTTLVGFHAGCDGGSERWGGACSSAIHHYCRSLGHAGGFGPVENADDYAQVICVDP